MMARDFRLSLPVVPKGTLNEFLLVVAMFVALAGGRE